MKVQAISPRQVSFKDDNTYIPPTYTVNDSITKLSKEGYSIQGKTPKDAFNKLHDDLNLDLKRTANAPTGVWFKDWSEGYRFDDKSVKYLVRSWDISKEFFSNLLTNFWEINKNNAFNNVGNSVENYLVNYEGLEKPSWFKRVFKCFGKTLEYIKKENILTNITENFLVKGQHRLK